MKPYTYLIGWSEFNRYYYGVQYGLKSDPRNLWTTYFTSSEEVKSFREQYGEPDIVQVRKEFDCPEKAKNWELKVLQRLKVVLREEFLNKNAAFAPPINNRGPLSKDTKEKISRALSGKPKSEEHAEKSRKVLYENTIRNAEKRKGKSLEEIYGEETAQNMRNAIKQSRKDQVIPPESYHKALETRRRNGGWKPHSDETKKKISEATKGKKRFNNGSVNKYFIPGTEPSNFKPGFIKRK